MAYYDDYDYYMSSAYERMAKTDTRSNYRLAVAATADAAPEARCYDCRFYQWGTCNLVEGTIEASYVCDLFTKMPELYPVNMTQAVKVNGGAHALFIASPKLQKANFAEGVAPDWIQYWPAPGRFNHPTYGEIVISAEANAQIVDNFANAVYQKSIPVDCEHDLVTSGAVGWIDQMRLAADGSIEAHVDWNERGTALLEQDRFRYFSPSIVFTWPHTVTGELIPNVAVGGAICTQPYFKESWLRPLVATEDGHLSVSEHPVRMSANPLVKPIRLFSSTPLSRQEDKPVSEQDESKKPPAGPAAFSDAEVAAFREFQAKGGLAQFAALEERAKTDGARVAALEQSARDSRFTEMIKGVQTFADGTTKQEAPWVGEREKHLRVMRALAATEGGEQGEDFKAYLETQRVAAEAAKKSGNFSEIGTGDAPEVGSATQDFLAQVKAEQEKNDKLNFSEAVGVVAKRNPQAYADYQQENTVRV